MGYNELGPGPRSASLLREVVTMRHVVVGWNVIGYERGEPVYGSVPLVRCGDCGREWWALGRDECVCSEEESD